MASQSFYLSLNDPCDTNRRTLNGRVYHYRKPDLPQSTDSRATFRSQQGAKERGFKECPLGRLALVTEYWEAYK